ncbi:apolipoprotein(a)-like [Haliotis rubra]|uniref:apolipoprotein(a)-like n=1 Tax=Haliotis rubra TaxID=36100 RepID=UPI001EE5F3CB|nr:apolipoprotein(a)-like [Haliotis rubra]
MARLLLFTTLAVLATLAACDDDCYRKQDGTAIYSGTKSVTASGKQCQAWSSQSPNIHSYSPEDFDVTNGAPNLSFNAIRNYCRDPSGGGMPSLGQLWCYTADEAGWETCMVSKCS